ncbi:hypothetical protein THAOC_15782, partial [Thalassiosira oceanica]
GKELSNMPGALMAELTADCANGGGTVGGRVRRLVLARNSVEQLDFLAVLTGLTYLDAGQNNVRDLPDVLAKTPIVELRIARNQLSSRAIASSSAFRVGDPVSTFATTLSTLDISGNGLEWLPGALSTLPNLSTLILANNNLTTLAAGTSDGEESGWQKGYTSLETLNLAGNNISNLGDLPINLIECCPLLRNLSLANNELTLIPPELGVLDSLTSFDLTGNPQRGVRMDILCRRASDQLAYLRSRLGENDLQSLESKRKAASGTAPSGDVGEEADASSCSTQRIDELRRSIEDITLQLNNVYLTEAKKYALKKEMKMLKASLIKVERQAKQMNR